MGDLLEWTFSPLEFLDSTALGGETMRFRFRLTEEGDPARFFRFGNPFAP